MRGWSMALAVALALLSAPAARAELPQPAPASAGSARVLEVIARVSANLEDSKYSAATRVDEKVGRYEFDCSGMAAWVLRRAAPKAHASVLWRAKTGRPLARDYYYQIAATKPGKPYGGWRRVDRVSEARAGDVIAWLKPPMWRSSVTGHVAFLVGDPVPAPGHENAFLLRIADASRYQHDQDSRAESGRTGFGTGTILVLAHPETGAPEAYGWFGLRSAWIMPTRMAIGRAEK